MHRDHQSWRIKAPYNVPRPGLKVNLHIWTSLSDDCPDMIFRLWFYCFYDFIFGQSTGGWVKPVACNKLTLDYRIPGSALFGYLDTWAENPSSEDESPGYNTGAVLSSMTAKALSSCTNLTTRQEMEDLRHQATLRCNGPDFKTCRPLKQPCVFDVESDPCERRNLYENIGETLSLLEAEMVTYRRTEVMPNNRRSEKLADPKYWNNTWTYWHDLPVPHMTPGQNKWIKTML